MLPIMTIAVCLFDIVFLAALVSAQVFVSSSGSYAGQLGTPPNLTAPCAETFSQTIVCDPMLRRVSQNAIPNLADLKMMCNAACITSLEALRDIQATQCTATDTVTIGERIYPATYMTDLLLYSYNWACVTDSPDNYCYPLFVQYNSAENKSSSDLCSACNLKEWQALLNGPLGYTNDKAALYSSLTSSCQVTSYPVTSPTRYVLGTTTTSVPWPTDARVAPTYTCESMYTIQESDSCLSISLEKQVSTFALLRSNKLPEFCVDFPSAGTEICIPQRCNTYQVSPVDTCASVAKAYDLTVAQLVEYNPNLNAQCGNLNSLAQYVICLSPLGVVTTTVMPIPPPLFTNPCYMVGAPSSCFDAPFETADPAWIVPWPTHTVNMSAIKTKTSQTGFLPTYTNPASLPRAPGTRENCTRYDIFKEDLGKLGNSCFFQADFWGITREQLLEWNPSLSQNVTDDESWEKLCQFQIGYAYCIKV